MDSNLEKSVYKIFLPRTPRGESMVVEPTGQTRFTGLWPSVKLGFNLMVNNHPVKVYYRGVEVLTFKEK